MSSLVSFKNLGTFNFKFGSIDESFQFEEDMLGSYNNYAKLDLCLHIRVINSLISSILHNKDHFNLNDQHGERFGRLILGKESPSSSEEHYSNKIQLLTGPDLCNDHITNVLKVCLAKAVQIHHPFKFYTIFGAYLKKNIIMKDMEILIPEIILAAKVKMGCEPPPDQFIEEYAPPILTPNSTISDLEDENINLRKQVNAVTEENNRLKQKTDELRAVIDQLNDVIQQIGNTINPYQDLFDSARKDSIPAQLRELLNSFLTEYNAAKVDLETAHADLRQTGAQSENLAERITQMKQSMSIGIKNLANMINLVGKIREKALQIGNAELKKEIKDLCMDLQKINIDVSKNLNGSN